MKSCTFLDNKNPDFGSGLVLKLSFHRKRASLSELFWSILSSYQPGHRVTQKAGDGNFCCQKVYGLDFEHKEHKLLQGKGLMESWQLHPRVLRIRAITQQTHFTAGMFFCPFGSKAYKSDSLRATGILHCFPLSKWELDDPCVWCSHLSINCCFRFSEETGGKVCSFPLRLASVFLRERELLFLGFVFLNMFMFILKAKIRK